MASVAGVGYQVAKDVASASLALSSFGLTVVGTMVTLGGTLYMMSGKSNKRKKV